VAEDSILPDDHWLNNLKPLAEEGPETFVLRRITQYILGVAVGIAVNIADLIAWIIGEYQSASVFAAEQFGSAILPEPTRYVPNPGLDNYAQWAIDGLTGVYSSMVDIMGPLAAPAILFVAALLAGLSIRFVRAGADSIPVVSGIQTFLEGN